MWHFHRACSSSRSMICVYAIVLGIGLMMPAARPLPAPGNDPAVEAKIQRIQDGLLPPVMVEGEASQPTKLADRMSQMRVPGISIAVIHDGKIEWARGFGVTKIGGPPVTPDTLFQAASISKPVAALAVLRLVESGKLNLDTDVNQYLKSWKVPENSFTEHSKVTLRRLLSHSAGMTVHGFPGYASDEPAPTLAQVLNGEKPANTPAIVVDIVPGTIWRYSGGGYVVVQKLLEDVTGQPFPKIMQEWVLGPAGMTHSTYEQPLPSKGRAEAAMPYAPDGQPIKGGPHVYPEMAPAGLWTTPSDLARYAIAVQESLAGKPNSLLSAKMAREMLTPVLLNHGLGPQVGGSGQHPYFTHGGANAGFQCDLVAYNQGDGVVIMTNSDIGSQLAGDIQRTIAHEYGWPDFRPISQKLTTVAPKVLEQYEGVYQLAPTFKLTVTVDSGQLMVQASGQGKVPVFPSSETKFFAKVVNAQIDFNKDEKGKVTSLTLHQGSNDMNAPRISDKVEERKEIPVSAEILKQYVGTYEIQPGLNVTITLEGNQLFTQVTGQPKFPLFAESETKFFLKIVDAQDEFVKDEKGAVTHIILRQGPNEVKAPRK
jgi:CubicO group peptidase (beta-lactamase class C family)